MNSVYRKDENCYPKLFLERNNSNNYYHVNSEEEYFGSDDPYKKIQMKKTPRKKIRIKKIKCTDSFLEEASSLIGIHCVTH